MNFSRYTYNKKIPYKGDRNQLVPLGTFLLWKDYSDYLKKTKEYNHICLNMSDVRWIRHYKHLYRLSSKEVSYNSSNNT